MITRTKLTVLFDGQYWIGIFERIFDGKMEVYKHIFGEEPSDNEVLRFIIEKYNHIKFSTPIIVEDNNCKKINPKRLQRKIRNEILSTGIGTKAQQAIAKKYETEKTQKVKRQKFLREEEEKVKFELRIKKKREKKKGH